VNSGRRLKRGKRISRIFLDLTANCFYKLTGLSNLK
jgi:hypothetical protein